MASIVSYHRNMLLKGLRKITNASYENISGSGTEPGTFVRR
jgi:hypothetical protein